MISNARVSLDAWIDRGPSRGSGALPSNKGMQLTIKSVTPIAYAVTIEVIERDSPQRELQVEPVLTVMLNGVSTTLRYWGSIDYIGGACSSDARGRPMVVYQARCGGSGCDAVGNWGIVDATNLRILLVPTDSNTDAAREILGAELPDLRQMISVHRAYQRLYPDQQ